MTNEEHFTPWTSAFQAACWISPLYYSTTLDEENHGNTQQQQQQQQPQQNNNNTDDPQQRIELQSTADGCSIATLPQKREDEEVLAWTLDAAARGVTVMGTAVFVSSELLRLAKEAAGCYMMDYQNIEGETYLFDCQERVYGMRPSSILTNIVMVVGLCSAIVMPLIGSIIDHTNHRRGVGTISAIVMSVFILIQMLVMQRYWFVAAILQVFVAFSYTVHLCAVYAYLPELTSDHDQLVHYTAQFSAAQYTGSVSFLLVMVVVLSTVNRNERFNSATLSQIVVLCICCLFFGYAWLRLFRPRPASQTVPQGKTLLSSGFWKIYKTGRTIVLHHSAIKWFLVSASFTEAATTTFSTIAITYMTDQLGFKARENGIAILLLLLFGVPGTRLAAWLTSRFNPIRSLQACLVVWIVNTLAAAAVLKGPGQQKLAYCFATVWGLCMGWVYPTEKTLYVTIIPRGQEGELMGTYICACQMLSWLPPLIFSVMNEADVSMRYGLSALTIYFMISFCILFFVGDYEEAVAHAREVDEGKRSFAVSPTNGLGMDTYGCYEEWAEPYGDELVGHMCTTTTEHAESTQDDSHEDTDVDRRSEILFRPIEEVNQELRHQDNNTNAKTTSN